MLVLTAAAAVLAMVPLAASVFWGPMAIAIMGGLIVGTAGKLIRGVEKSWTSLVFGLVTFGAIAIVRLPLQFVLLILVPLSILWALYRARRKAGRP